MPPVPPDIDEALMNMQIADVLHVSPLAVESPDFPLVWKRNALIKIKLDGLLHKKAMKKAQERRRKNPVRRR